MEKFFIVYYYIDFSLPVDDINVSMLDETHKRVRTFYGEHTLNEIFEAMQGEVWSPNGEQRDYIHSLGLTHTSMSVGDVVYVGETGKWMLADFTSWKELAE